MMVLLVFPILLYIFYYFSTLSRTQAFSIAFLNDWVCWITALYVYHYETKFEYWNDGESQLVTYTMIEIKLLIVIIAVISYVLKAMFSRVKLSDLRNETYKNYNNYLYGQRMDYHDKNLFFINKKYLFAYFSRIEKREMKHIKILNTRFQIEDSKIYYVNNGNLIESTLDFSKRKVVSSEVLNFLIVQNEFYYTKKNTEKCKTLFHKRIDAEEKVIFENMKWFCAYKQGVLILKEKKLSRFEYEIIEINTQEYYEKNISLLQCNNILHRLYLVDEMIIFIDNDNVVSSFNLGTQEQKVIFNPPKGVYDVNLICDINFVYLSIQKIERDGSAVFDMENDKNGLYKIDIQTRIATKICDKTCDEMYLFGGYIFGYKRLFSGNRLLQISEFGEICTEIF
jgi:hypothetical protein